MPAAESSAQLRRHVNGGFFLTGSDCLPERKWKVKRRPFLSGSTNQASANNEATDCGFPCEETETAQLSVVASGHPHSFISEEAEGLAASEEFLISVFSRIPRVSKQIL